MERYASLAPYGQHRGPAATDDAATSSEVRGLPAEDGRPNAKVEQKPSAQQNPPAAASSHSRYRLSRRGGEYVLTTLREGDGTTAEQEAEAVGEYDSVQAATGAVPSEMQFYVFENSETGAVEMRQARDLSHGLTLGDGFDRLRIFASQADAEAYAKDKSR